MESAPNTRMSNVRSSGGISTNPFDDLIDECPRSGNCGEGQAEPYSPIALSGLLGPNGMLWPAPNTSQPKELGSTTGRYQAVAEGLAERHTDAKPKCSQQEQVPTGWQQWGGLVVDVANVTYDSSGVVSRWTLYMRDVRFI